MNQTLSLPFYMSLINNRDGVHFDSQSSPHVRLNIMRHKSSVPNRATLIHCKTKSGFLFTVFTFGKPLKGTFMSRDRPFRSMLLVALALPFGRPLMRCFTKTIFLIIIYHESPHTGIFYFTLIFSYVQL